MSFGLEPLYTRIRKLEELIEAFIEEVNQMELMKDPAIRNPPAKHQRIIREIHDLVKGFEYNYKILKEEGEEVE